MSKLSSDATRVHRNFNLEAVSTEPTLSVVIPCYGVADYVTGLLVSLSQQDCNREAVELIFVIDGSPDNTEEIVSAWMRDCDFQATLVWQENRGLAGARNTGNSFARGELINTPDPDDTLSANYFSEILQAAAENPGIALFVSRMIRVTERGQHRGHALDFKFTNVTENTVVDLSLEPEKIHLAGGLITVKRKFIEEHSLKYDGSLVGGFEDAFFVAQYLLSQDAPEYMVLPRAHYYYLIRGGSITSQPINYENKLNVVKIAHRQLLDQAGDVCPQWLGNVLLYDLYWTFRSHTDLVTSVFALSSGARSEFFQVSREVLSKVGIDTVRRFRVVTLSLDIRAAWEAAIDPSYVTRSVVRWAYDEVRELQKLSFFSGNPNESASIYVDGSQLDTAFYHVREVAYFDEPWAFEHIYWVDVSGRKNQLGRLVVQGAQGTEFTDAGRAHGFNELQKSLGAIRPEAPKLSSRDVPMSAKPSKKVIGSPRLRKKLERFRFAMAYRMGGLLGWRHRFKNAWVLMDSKDQANDNAEHLYRYLRSNRPDINAWYVNTKNSPDWKRLEAEGFRLVSYGSVKHFLLMKESAVLASSHLDHYIVQPFKREYLPKTWIYSFLQHGVTKDKQDRWFNKKSIDHLVTSTKAETDSIIENPSPYKLSEREVTLTGMPRHDRLHRLSQRAQAESSGAKQILVMPTWRKYLAPMVNSGNLDAVAESEYAQMWGEFLTGAYVQELVKQDGVEVVFLPHRGSAEYWKTVKLPSGVRFASYVTDDIQELIATSTMTITDYSSQAFEGAFCGLPCVYFQFDRTDFFSGEHVYSPGYFDYERDGFGPVATNVEALIKATDLMLNGNHPHYVEYIRRIADLYPLRDEDACSRVVAEIEKRSTPRS